MTSPVDDYTPGGTGPGDEPRAGRLGETLRDGWNVARGRSGAEWRGGRFQNKGGSRVPPPDRPVPRQLIGRWRVARRSLAGRPRNLVLVAVFLVRGVATDRDDITLTANWTTQNRTRTTDTTILVAMRRSPLDPNGLGPKVA